MGRSPSRRLRRALTHPVVAAAVLGGLIVALLEVAWVSATAVRPLDLRTALAILGIDTLAVIVVTLVLTPVWLLLRLGHVAAPSRSFFLRAAAAGVALSAPVLGLLIGVTLNRWTALAALHRAICIAGWVALPISGALAGVGVARFLPLLRRSPVRVAAVGAGLLGLGFLALVVDATVLVRLYPRFHFSAAYAAVLLSACSVLWAFPSGLGRGAPYVLTLGGSLVAAALLSPITMKEQTYIALRVPIAAKSTRVLRALVDRDKDGFSPLFGGGDCDDSDPLVNAARVDLPENGVDEDCFMGDLKLEAIVTGRDPAPASAPKLVEPTPVFLFTIDTVRADHVGAYGYARPTSPNFDALAREAVLFVNAFAPANNTASSVPSLMTGRYPSASRWSFVAGEQYAVGWPFLRDADNTTLAEVLGQHGYHCVALSMNPVLFKLGLEQDFAVVRGRPAGIVDEFRSVLREAPERLFAWMHTDHPHEPYRPREAVFGQRDVDKYDAEIREADQLLGEAFQAIRERGLWDRAIIVVTSDHGEEFGEHGGHTHASSLYNEQVRVPLVVKLPGLAPGRVTKNVELVDVMPTLLATLELPEPSSLDGDHLLAPRARADSTAYIEHFDGRVQMRALVHGSYKLLHRVYNDVALELYDLDRDPGERRNLIEEHVDEATAARLHDLQARLGQTALAELLRLVAAVRRGSPEAAHDMALRLNDIADPNLRRFAASSPGLPLPDGGAETGTALIH